jgi:hypothetical protein
VLSGIPTDATMRVVGERMGGRDSGINNRWRWVALEVRPRRKVASSTRVGHVFVDRARLMFADIDSLGAWKHDDPTDGLADLVFWGRNAEEAAKETKAPRLSPPTESNPVYGWENLPDLEARQKGSLIWQAKEKNEWMLALDYRPHSHHWEVMRQVRDSKTESGTIGAGGATMCGFMTSWGDGLYPVIVERDSGGEVVRVRLQLGDDDRTKRLYDVMERSTRR